ncbi:hypothetical protein RQP46_010793 [Phenoliferia psychrophenolica]
MPSTHTESEVDVLIVGAGPSGLMLATWLSKINIKTRIIDKRGTKVFTGQADGVQVLTQGRIERFMIDAMYGFNGLTVDRAILPTSLSVSPDLAESHPITITLRHLSEEEATPTQVGAVPNGIFRSNVLADDEADAHAAASGTVGMEETVKAKYVVGCDGARSWVRKQLGITLDGDSADVYWGVLDVLVKTDFPDIRLKCTNRSSITPETIIAKAQAIMAPYKLEVPFVDWWTVYEVGQRLSATVTDERERVFIAGFNLGWKLAGVLKGQLSSKVLGTYQTERHKVAQELIDADYKLSRLFSGKGPQRFESHQVVSVGDARPWHIADRFVADGRFRVVIFAGDVRETSQMSLLGKVASYLDSPQGPLRIYTPSGADIDSVFEIITVISNPRTLVEPNAFPDILWPAKGQYGIRDYEKIYADDDTYLSGHGHIYEKLGIDPKLGCLVVVRPDQHVAMVCRVEEFVKLGAFFDAIMLKPVA